MQVWLQVLLHTAPPPAMRVRTADKGRYNNTVTFTYDDAGRVATEALTVDSQTYTISRDYDDAGRLSIDFQIRFTAGGATSRGCRSGVVSGSCRKGG